MKRTIAALSLLCLSAVALTGCTTDTPAKNGKPISSSSPTKDSGTGIELTELITVDFSETVRSERALEADQELPLIVDAEGNTATLLLGGSGSCAPEVLEVAYNETTSVLQVSWAPFAEEAQVCTMDFVQYESKLVAPEDVDLATAKAEFSAVVYGDPALEESPAEETTE